MSVSGILSSALFSIGAHFLQNRTQKVHTEFQQLGQDLQAGNLSAAQSDFATLQQLRGRFGAGSSGQSTSSITQDFNQLAADLRAGNLTAAQQDFTAIQQDLQTVRSHHPQVRTNDGSGIGQLFGQLGQALQSGSLSTAQQAYAALQQNFEQYAQINGVPAQSSLSLNA